jgi:hypothetical protein
MYLAARGESLRRGGLRFSETVTMRASESITSAVHARIIG